MIDLGRLVDLYHSKESTQGAIVKLVGRDPSYRSYYMVDYKALTGLSLLRVPQQSVWPGAPCE
jgi:hypothetical protein